MHIMNEIASKPNALRLVAAVILGIIFGTLLFFIVALFIGIFNNIANMNISFRTDVAENMLSAALLVIFIGFSIAGFCWKVWTTPSSEEEAETPEVDE